MATIKSIAEDIDAELHGDKKGSVIVILTIISILLSAIRLAYDCGLFGAFHMLRNPNIFQKWKLKSIIEEELNKANILIDATKLRRLILQRTNTLTDKDFQDALTEVI